MTPEHAKRTIEQIRRRARAEQALAHTRGEKLRIDARRLQAEAEVLRAVSASLLESAAGGPGSAVFSRRTLNR